MNHRPVKLRPPGKRYGGKDRLARRIIARFDPDHDVYVEPYFGMGAVLLNKPRAKIEIAGDIEPGLIRTWRAIRDRAGSLHKQLTRVRYSRATWEWAEELLDDPDDVTHALGYLVRHRMSRGGMGETFSLSTRLRGGQEEGANAWSTFLEPRQFFGVAERVRGVQFFCEDAVVLIRAFGCSSRSLIYLDPTYHPDTRSIKRVYRHEMTHAQHVQLLDAVTDPHRRARVYLSHYPHPLYERRLAGWHQHRWDMPNNASQARVKQRRTEILFESPSR